MKFKTWKTIKLGTGLKTTEDFSRALNKIGGCHISRGCYPQVNTIFESSNFRSTQENIEVDLVNVSADDLGFSTGARCRDIYSRAQELGLIPCPGEVGPQLCLQFKDQLINEGVDVSIGMESVLTTPGPSWKRIFSILDLFINNGELVLAAINGGPGSPWARSNRFVFLKPR
jgi:hypothetical protein